MKIVLAGDWTHPDFEMIVGRLLDSTDKLPPGTDPPSDAPSGPPPDLLILAQSRSQQFDPRWSDGWLAAWPRTPAVLLQSSSCEGEARSGKPLPGWARVYWHRFSSEFQDFVAARTANRPSIWDRTQDSRHVDLVRASDWTGGICLTLGIVARWNDEIQLMEQFLQPLGHLTRRLNPVSPVATELKSVDALLLVADSCDAWLEHYLVSARRGGRSLPKIVLMGFPRRQDAARVSQLGGRRLSIVSKPFRVGHIQHLLQSFAANRPPAIR